MPSLNPHFSKLLALYRRVFDLPANFFPKQQQLPVPLGKTDWFSEFSPQSPERPSNRPPQFLRGQIPESLSTSPLSTVDPGNITGVLSAKPAPLPLPILAVLACLT